MYQVGDRLQLKKAHPCGGDVWEVVRTGADIKLRCTVCGKFVNVMRDDLKKRVKSVLEKKDVNA